MNYLLQGDAILLQCFYRTKGGKYVRDSIVVVSCVTQHNNVVRLLIAGSLVPYMCRVGRVLERRCVLPLHTTLHAPTSIFALVHHQIRDSSLFYKRLWGILFKGCTHAGSCSNSLHYSLPNQAAVLTLNNAEAEVLCSYEWTPEAVHSLESSLNDSEVSILCSGDSESGIVSYLKYIVCYRT